MLKVYGRNDMFLKCKELFEETLRKDFGSEVSEHSHSYGSSAKVDAFTYSSMLEASASAQQWEYFEYVYKEMVLSGHQVDQRKHSALFVEAYRAGKWHLLEHAFDSILEAGEIPPLSFFIEMVCEATVQCNHERVVNIVHAMAHTPFQVSVHEWMNLFDKNCDRINRASLNELQEKVASHDLIKEARVLNLSRALQVICGSCEDTLNSTNSTSSTMDDENAEAHFVNTSGSNLDWNLNIHESNPVKTENDYCFNSRRVVNDTDSVQASGLSDRYDEDTTRAHSTRFADEEFEHMEHEHEAVDSEDDDEFNFELIIPSNVGDDSHDSDTPSAYEILQNWRNNSRI